MDEDTEEIEEPIKKVSFQSKVSTSIDSLKKTALKLF